MSFDVRMWLICALVVQQVVQAQPLNVQTPEDRATVRASIEVQRTTSNEEFNRHEAACQDRFAVTSCITDVKRKRIAAMSQYKREEAALNDLDRKQRANEQLEAIKAKREERALEDERLLDSTITTQEERQLQQNEKRVEHRQKGIQQNTAVGRSKKEVEDRTATDISNRADYDRRQQEAAERRAKRDKSVSDAQKGISPLPPTP